ncbi:MAG: spore coat protein CotJB [Clostridia bacterium]|nr:spore coat protein CotJB [Oscillospiraceae bacterium]MBR6693749.1 spore coat protein CotJB [Clostridia bacterium]
MNKEQAMQLRRLSSIHFALVELNLFLDTHPDNGEALKMFNSYKAKYEALLRAYEQNYGPITTMGTMGNTTWDWIKGPWPWEPLKESIK